MIEPIGADVRGELGRFGETTDIAEVVAAWPAVVGEQIARNAWPARIGRDGTLHVHTDSSAWAFELAQLAPTILERLRDVLGAAAPRGVRFAVGSIPEPAERDTQEARERAVTPGPDEVALAHELTSGVTVEELRKFLARAAAATLARESADR